MGSETGVQKSVRRIITTGVFLTALVVLYFVVHAIFSRFGSGIELPNLSNHDFEWLVVFLLVIIYGKDCDHECKCKKN
jgi:hypothetical protein